MEVSRNNKEEFLSNEELERYKRHLSLKDFGIEGQISLKNSSVIFIGAGGLGSSAILYSAAAGIGELGIVDADQVEVSNLQRQIIHNTFEIGNNKTDSTEKNIRALNPHCSVKKFTERININNVIDILSQFDIVCDCSDNFNTRFLVNDACLILNKPLIYGSVQGFEGQVSVFNLNKNSPNLRDLLPKPPQEDLIPSCAEYGVLGITPGIIGVLQANEIIKIIIKKGEILDGKVLIFNLLENNLKKLNLEANNKYKNINDLTLNNKDYESKKYLEKEIKKISPSEFKKIYEQSFNEIIIVDVREKNEFKQFSIKGSISLPLSLIEKKSSFDFIKNQSAGKKIYTLCQKGKRSNIASQLLIESNIESVSIEGGLDKIGDINKII
tara:strand:- start:3962 stop:5110 length:1149 start_codon:yes stop_codon:yes gene_type:complete